MAFDGRDGFWYVFIHFGGGGYGSASEAICVRRFPKTLLYTLK